MKKLLYFAMMAAMASCTGNVQKLGSGLDKTNMDSTIAPGEDFYQYATGGWQKAHPLTAEYSRFGSFDLLQENCNKQLKGIIDSVSELKYTTPGSIEQKIATLYHSAMDSVELNRHGKDEMILFLQVDVNQNSEKIAQEWLQQVWPRMLNEGVDGLFGFYIGADDKDSKNNILSVSQSGLTLGQKDYYVDEDEATKKIREAYKTYIADLAKHCGFCDRNARNMVEDVMRIETRLAKASRSMTQLRDPEANYNKMTYAKLKTTFPGISWDEFFGVFGIKGLKQVVVGQPEVLHEVEKILKEEKPEALQNLYLWHAMDMAAGFIDDESRAIQFAFWGKAMSGRQEDKPRWKRAVASVENGLGEALGQLYVARYFPPEAKTRMENLVANLQKALGKRIDAQDWMSAETKKVAHEKLDAFYVKVGYPNKWKNYSTLQIGDSYLQNMLACNMWQIQDMIKTHLNKPVDKDEWQMTPQTINAYYNPTTNEICFPAGILQPPFFDMQADDAFNYGAIGVVIGHEMTHGFDDQGSKYDKDGNLHQWWNKEDTRRFTDRIQVMRRYHDNIEVLPGLHANGSLTLGENMADHGGLMVAFEALKMTSPDNSEEEVEDYLYGEKKDGFTAAQRFFLAYAGVWGQNIREAEIRNRVKGDPHQLGRWRVNGQLPHVDAWYKAFNITKKDKMYVPKKDRVTIW